MLLKPTRITTTNARPHTHTNIHREGHSILWPNGKTAFEFRFNPIVKCDLNLPMETLESNALRGGTRGAGGVGLKMRFAFESAAFLCELRSGNLLKLSLHVGEPGTVTETGTRRRRRAWTKRGLCVSQIYSWSLW